MKIMDKQDIIEEITLDLILSNDSWVGDGAKITAANIYKAYIEPLKLAVEHETSAVDRAVRVMENTSKIK